MRRALRVLLVVLAVVALAGCSAPFGGETTTPTETTPVEETPTPAEQTHVEETPASEPTATSGDAGTEESDLRFEPSAYKDLGTPALEGDENETYDRVAAMLESDAEPPRLVVQGEGDNSLRERLESRFDLSDDPQLVRLNMTGVRFGDGPTGIAYPNRIVVDPGNGSPAEVETVLSHEFTHHVQSFDGWLQGWVPRGWGEESPPRGTLERQIAARALVEGGAVYAADQYAARYIEGIETDRFQTELQLRSYTDGQPGNAYAAAPYALGGVYVHQRIDDPANLDSVYEDPPATTYEMLFPEENATGSVTGPTVDVNTTGPALRGQHDNRMGAIFLHTLVTSTHSRETADEVVRGYRGDHMVELLSGRGEHPFVWALSFETEAAAESFVTVFEEGLEGRTDEYASEFGLEQEGKMVVVVAADEQRRQTAEIEVAGQAVDVSLGTGESASDIEGLRAGEAVGHTDSTVAPAG